MSIKLMSMAWESAPVEGTDLLLLLALADFANDSGESCYPSIATLAKRMRKSERSVSRGISSLEKAGLLEVVLRGGGRNSSRYRIVVSALEGRQNVTPDKMSPLSPVSGQPCHGCQGTPVTDVTPPPSRVSTDPPLTRQFSSSIEPPSFVPTAFDQFWQAYPKKRKKPDAEKAWKQVKADEHLAAILESIEAHKRIPQWCKDGGEFIPHPATWLRARGWEDDLTTELNSGGKTQKELDMKAQLQRDIQLLMGDCEG